MGYLDPNSFFVKGQVFSVKAHVKKVQENMRKLSQLTQEQNAILENIKLQYPESDIIEECNFNIDKAEQENSNYVDKLQEIQEGLVDFLGKYDKVEKEVQQTISRDRSPGNRRSQYIKMDHLRPEKLEHTCSPLIYKKFKKEFKIWMANIHPYGYSQELFVQLLFNRLDSSWEDRLSILGSNTNEKELWDEMDQQMLNSHPLHNHRIPFLNSKLTNVEALSTYLQDLIEDAGISEIKYLTTSSIRLQPNLQEVGPILSTIIGLESDQLATTISTNKAVHSDKVVKDESRKCFICNSPSNLARDCQTPCKACRLTGHKTGDTSRCDKVGGGSRGQSSVRGDRPGGGKNDRPAEVWVEETDQDL